eukprot:344974-Chlamydomonas_euryale.AAC.4
MSKAGHIGVAKVASMLRLAVRPKVPSYGREWSSCGPRRPSCQVQMQTAPSLLTGAGAPKAPPP